MFKKLLASVGIGSASVDTRLQDDVTVPGGVLNGEVMIRGGDLEQEIDNLYLYIGTRYKRESGDSTVVEECKLGKYELVKSLVLQPKETKSVPFSIQIPFATPLSIGHNPIYLRTGLDIESAIDPKDTDKLTVHPHPLQQKVLEAVEQLGFRLYHVEHEYNRKWLGPYPFVQEFEFRPAGHMRYEVKELEVIFHLQEHGLDVFLEIDKRLRGVAKLFEDFDLHERYVRFHLSNDEVYRTDLAPAIDQLIQQRIRR